MINTEDVIRYIRRITSPAFSGTPPDSAEIVVDKTTNTFKYHSNGTHEAVALDLTQTITGDKTFSGSTAFTGAVAGTRASVSVTAADTIAITAAQSGTVFVATKASATQVFTLPAAATAGLTYTFVCGDPATEIHVGVATGDRIVGKVSADTNALGLLTTVTTGLLKGTAASNVLGDSITLVSDGLVSHYIVAQTGVYSAT